MNMVRDFDSRSPAGNDNVLSKMRQRLKEKEKALEVGKYFYQRPPPIIDF